MSDKSLIELVEEINEYVNLGTIFSTLDGNFTAEQLRLIADAMDKKRQMEYIQNPKRVSTRVETSD